jgi:septum formation protein
MQPIKNRGKLAMAETKPLILASGSRFRRDMLQRAGLNFSVVPARVDEAAIKNAMIEDDPDLEAAVLAQHLADAKALSVSETHTDAIVIGSDQVLVCGGEIFSKPPSVVAARQQLVSLRGLTHALPTAATVAIGGKIVWRHMDEPQMTMRPFSDAFLEAYIATEGDSLCETVGGYKFEGRGVQLFETMEGDMFSVVGLPLVPLLAELRRLGVLAT